MKTETSIKIDYLEFSLFRVNCNLREMTDDEFIELACSIAMIEHSYFDKERKPSMIKSYDEYIQFNSISCHFAYDYLDEYKEERYISRIRFALSGGGCDQFMSMMMMQFHHFDMSRFLKSLNSKKYDKVLKIKINRIDIANDQINNERIPSVCNLFESIKHHQIRSLSRNYQFYANGELDETKKAKNGATLYLGTRPQRLRIYDKLEEQKQKHQPISPSWRSWIRFELELLNEKAALFIEMLDEQDTTVSQLFVDVMKAHYNFVTKATAKKIDKDKKSFTEYESQGWYSRLLSNAKKQKLAVFRANTKLSSAKKWKQHQISPSLYRINVAERVLMNYETNYFNENELKEINFKDKDVLNFICNLYIDYELQEFDEDCKRRYNSNKATIISYVESELLEYDYSEINDLLLARKFVEMTLLEDFKLIPFSRLEKARKIINSKTNRKRACLI